MPPANCEPETYAFAFQVIQRQLKMEGILTTIANHGQEAIDILVAEQSKFPNPTPIAVVLMDIELVFQLPRAFRELYPDVLSGCRLWMV